VFGVTATALVAYYWKPIKRFLSQETSDLAQQTMQDEGLQQEVDRITQQTTNTLLNDPQTVQVSMEFLIRLLEKPETRQQVVTFVSQVLQDPSTVQALAQVLRDPVTLKQLQSSFNMLLNDATIRASLNDLVFQLLQQPETQRLLENLVMDLLKRENVKESTADFFGQVLQYPEVISSATDTSKDVVANLTRDEQVHKYLAQAGTSALKRMVIPGFLFRHHGDKNGSSKDGDDEKKIGVIVQEEPHGDEDGVIPASVAVESLVKDQQAAQAASHKLPAQ
jgi:hypothetical protein